MSEINEVYKSKTIKSMYLSISFFVIVFLLTLALFFYNSYLEKQSLVLKTEISQKEKGIKEKNADNNIQVYQLYTLNKEVISRLEKYSKIVTYINHIDEISQQYDIKLSNFNYNNGILNLEAEAQSDEAGLDYQKTSKFIKDYRLDKEALFNLLFINSISTVENKEKFSIKLELK